MDLTTLQRTVTHREQFYYTTKIGVINWLNGWLRWPEEPLPEADNEKHYIILEMADREVVQTTIQTDPAIRFKFDRKKCDSLLLVQVDLRSDTFVTPIYNCILADGYELGSAFKLLLQVSDARQCWQAHKNHDPLAELESQIKETAVRFFSNYRRADLLSTPVELVEALHKPHQPHGQIRMREQLENEVQKIEVAGLKLHKVRAILTLEPELAAYLKQKHEELQSGDNLLEQMQTKHKEYARRQYINSLLDKDLTFAPYSLREVAIALDTKLLEQFYTNDWPGAMEAVHKTLAEKQKNYLESPHKSEIDNVKQWLQMAQSAGLRDDALRKLEQVLLDKMVASSKQQERKMPSVQEFLRLLIKGTESI